MLDLLSPDLFGGTYIRDLCHRLFEVECHDFTQLLYFTLHAFSDWFINEIMTVFVGYDFLTAQTETDLPMDSHPRRRRPLVQQSMTESQEMASLRQELAQAKQELEDQKKKYDSNIKYMDTQINDLYWEKKDIEKENAVLKEKTATLEEKTESNEKNIKFLEQNKQVLLQVKQGLELEKQDALTANEQLLANQSDLQVRFNELQTIVDNLKEQDLTLLSTKNDVANQNKLLELNQEELARQSQDDLEQIELLKQQLAELQATTNTHETKSVEYEGQIQILKAQNEALQVQVDTTTADFPLEQRNQIQELEKVQANITQQIQAVTLQLTFLDQQSNQHTDQSSDLEYQISALDEVEKCLLDQIQVLDNQRTQLIVNGGTQSQEAINSVETALRSQIEILEKEKVLIRTQIEQHTQYKQDIQAQISRLQGIEGSLTAQIEQIELQKEAGLNWARQCSLQFEAQIKILYDGKVDLEKQIQEEKRKYTIMVQTKDNEKSQVIAEYTARINTCNTKVVSLENQIKILQANLDSQVSANQALTTENLSLNQRILVLDSNINALSIQLEQERTEKEQCLITTQGLQEDKRKLNSEISILNQRIDNCEQDKVNLNNTINQLRIDKSGLTKEIQQLQFAIQDHLDQIASHEKLVETLRKQLQGVLGNIQLLEADIEIHIDQKQTLQLQLIQLQNLKNTLENQIQQLELEKTGLQNELVSITATLNARIEALTKENTSLKEQLALCTSEKRSITFELNQCQLDLKDCDGRIKICDNTKIDLNVTIGNLTQELNQCRTDCDSKSGDFNLQITQLNLTINNLNNKLDICTNENTTLTNLVAALEKAKSELQAQIVILKQQITELTITVNTKTQQNEQITIKVNELNILIEQLRQQINLLTQEKNDFIIQIGKFGGDTAELQRLLDICNRLELTLKQEITVLEQTITNINIQLQESRNDLNIQITNCNKRTSDMQSEIDRLTIELQTCKNGSQTTVIDYDQRITILNQEISRLKVIVENNRVTIQTLTQEIDAGKTLQISLQNQINALTGDKQSLEYNIQQLTINISQLDGQITNLTELRTQLQIQIQQCQAELDALRRTGGENESKYIVEINILTEQNEQLNITINNLKLQITNLQATIDRLRNENQALTIDLSQEKQQTSSLTIQIQDLTSVKTGLEQQISILNRQLIDIQSQVSTLTGDNRTLTGQVSGLTFEKSQAELKLEQCLKDLEEKQSQVINLTTLQINLQRQIDDLLAQLRNLQGDCDSSDSKYVIQIQQLDALVESLRVQIKILQDEKDALTIQINEIRVTFQQQIQVIELERNQLRVQIDTERSRYLVLQQEYDQYKIQCDTSITNLNIEIESLKRQIQACGSETSGYTIQITNLTLEIEQLKIQIADLTARLDACQNPPDKCDTDPTYQSLIRQAEADPEYYYDGYKMQDGACVYQKDYYSANKLKINDMYPNCLTQPQKCEQSSQSYLSSTTFGANGESECRDICYNNRRNGGECELFDRNPINGKCHFFGSPNVADSQGYVGSGNKQWYCYFQISRESCDDNFRPNIPIPLQPSAPTTISSGSNIRVQWNDPSTGGFSSTKFEIRIKSSDVRITSDPLVTYYSTSSCDGSNQLTIQRKYCDIPMSVLTQAPFNLAQGSEVLAVVRASSSAGWGEFSLNTTQGGLITTRPQNLPALNALQNGSALSINVSGYRQTSDFYTGGAAITKYTIEWDNGTFGSSWSIIYTDSVQSSIGGGSFTHTRDVRANQSYQFRYRAENIHGVSDFSQITRMDAIQDQKQLNCDQEYQRLVDGGLATLTAGGFGRGTEGYELEEGACVFEKDYYSANKLNIQKFLKDIQRQEGNTQNGCGATETYSCEGTNDQFTESPTQALSVEGKVFTNDDHLSYCADLCDRNSECVQMDLNLTTKKCHFFAAPTDINDKYVGSGNRQWDCFKKYSKVCQDGTLASTTRTVSSSFVSSGRQVAQLNNEVVITWPETPSTGGNVVYAYRVQFEGRDGNLYESSQCNGSDYNVYSDRSCTVQMSALTQDPFNLAAGQPIKATVEAKTINGWFNPQAARTTPGTVSSKPSAPGGLVSRGEGTNDGQLVLNWDALEGSDTGFDTITNYEVHWDQGTNGIYWKLLAQQPGSTDSSYTYTERSKVVKGTLYQVKYRAQNQYGYGDFSQVNTILAAASPDQIPAPSTRNSGTDVIVQWEEPNNRGSEIDQYLVIWLGADGREWMNTNECNGQDAEVIRLRTCKFPRSQFTSSNTNLLRGDVITFKVYSKNAIGWSIVSTGNTTGAVVK